MIIDPKSHVPIYRQIVEQVRSAIDAGVYRPGEALPSLRALAVEIRVNPNTVQRAYEELDRQGVIESRRGLGVFGVLAEESQFWDIQRDESGLRDHPPSCRNDAGCFRPATFLRILGRRRLFLPRGRANAAVQLRLGRF